MEKEEKGDIGALSGEEERPLALSAVVSFLAGDSGADCYLACPMTRSALLRPASFSFFHIFLLLLPYSLFKEEARSGGISSISIPSFASSSCWCCCWWRSCCYVFFIVSAFVAAVAFVVVAAIFVPAAASVLLQLLLFRLLFLLLFLFMMVLLFLLLSPRLWSLRLLLWDILL